MTKTNSHMFDFYISKIVVFSLIVSSIYSSEFYLGGRQYVKIEENWYNKSQNTLGGKIFPHRIIIRKTDNSILLKKDIMETGLTTDEFQIHPKPLLDKYYILSIDHSVNNPFEFTHRLYQSDKIAYIEFDTHVHPTNTPNDPEFINQWNLNTISMLSAWEITTGSEDVTVAVIDAGIQYSLSEFHGNIWNNLGEDSNDNGTTIIFDGEINVLDPGDINGIDDDGNGYIDDLIGWNYHGDNNNPSAVLTHGTYVASVIGAKTNNNKFISGIAGGWGDINGSQLMCLSNQAFGSLSLSAINSALAIEYAYSNGANVINMSWTIDGQTQYYEYLTEVIEAGYNDHNVVFINSSGNDCGGTNQYPHITFPGELEEVIAVGSVDQNDLFWHDDTSHWGSCYGPELDVVAPHAVYAVHPSGDGCATSFGGTSAAAPHVSGLAALLLSVNLNLTNIEVRDIIINSTDKVSEMNGENFTEEYGYGRINAFAALLSQFDLGDVNTDQTINVSDIIIIINIIIYDYAATNTELHLADINSDEVIDLLDIVQIISIIIN